MGIIKGICISEKRGTQKHEVSEAKLIADWGIENECTCRTLASSGEPAFTEKIEAFRARGVEVEFGAFGENLIVVVMISAILPVGTRFRCNDVLLEMTQIGKECHSHCEIYKVVGDCIMPREGVFAKVLQGGTIKVGDELVMEETGE